ncbi:hypothetical protein IS386_004527 [Salmonella enterica]|nr:hypothetical protein [Salmonella enterica]EIV4412565.1 hypothetical protein [Salmonella enterica]
MFIKHTLKNALIISGLMGSSAAMAAMGGTPIQGGSGSVNITGTVSAATCSAAIDSTNHSFIVTTAELAQPSGTSLARPYSTITLSGCNGLTLNPTINASNLYGTDGWYGAFSEYTDNTISPLRYQVAFEGDGISGGAISNGLIVTTLNGLTQPTGPVNIPVNSDHYVLKLITDIKTTGNGYHNGISLTPTATYTYNLNYA